MHNCWRRTLPGKTSIALAVFDDRRAVDKDGFHARRMAAHFLGVDRVGKLLADQIVDLIGIENRHVRGHAFLQQTAVEAQLFAGKPVILCTASSRLNRFFSRRQ